MALKERLDENDLALVDVIEDPIMFAEFMRNTRDGSINKATWPTKEFKYRHYQRALVSDRSDKIVLTGGRACGKCQPLSAKIYTTKGYESIFDLRREPVFEVYCLDDDAKLTTRRAVLQKDMWTKTYTVTTESGYTTHATMEHPFLTPSGYVKLEELVSGDMVAVSTHLPWNSVQRLWSRLELRTFGLIWLNDTWRIGKPLPVKRQKIRDEWRAIAKEKEYTFIDGIDTVTILRKKHHSRNFVHQMAHELGFLTLWSMVGRDKRLERCLPDSLKRECKEHIQWFLENTFAQFGEMSRKSVTLDCRNNKSAQDIRELLLRFGIESIIDNSILSLRDERAIYRFYTQFDIPGVSVENLSVPPASLDIAPHMRYEKITSITLKNEKEITYALYVYDHHNYIADGIHVHNSLVLEDKHLYDIINQDILYPETKEMLLTTNNQAQLEPIQGRLITRLTTSPLLKPFLENRINRSLGVFDFRFGDLQFLLRTRIAGTTGAQNMVGLHVTQINVDEAQLFTMQAWSQLAPALNSWQDRTQVFICGVGNGLRTSLLYNADRKLDTWKRYRIPAHNNPYYTQELDLENIKRYGGEDTDDYKQLVVAQHGNAAFTVITRDQITQKTYPFFTFKYTGADISKGTKFEDVLERPDLSRYTSLTAGIDCGYVDPSVISVVGLTDMGIWEYAARYVLQRVDMNTQEKIVSWLDEQYYFDKIGIDTGSGGGGTQMLHSLLYRPEYVKRQFEGRLIPVQFGERITVGFNSDGKELQQTTKTLGAVQLVQQMQQGNLILSEIDHAAVSELERITKMKGVSGDDRYFILSEKGNGASPNDHLFASMICWAIATRDMSFQKPKRKRLGRSAGNY